MVALKMLDNLGIHATFGFRLLYGSQFLRRLGKLLFNLEYELRITLCFVDCQSMNILQSCPVARLNLT